MLYFQCKSYVSTTNYGRVITWWIFQIDISQNNKSVQMVGFPKSSHILELLYYVDVGYVGMVISIILCKMHCTTITWWN